VGAIDKRGMVHPATEYKGLPVTVTKVGGHLNKVIIGFIGVHIGQGGVPAKPGFFGNLDRILGAVQRTEGARQDIPGHQTFTDDVEIGSAVVRRATIGYAVIEELAKLKFHFVAYLNRPIFARVPAALLVVMQVVDNLHGAVIEIFGDGINPAIEPAVFGFGIVEAKLRHHIHAYAIATFGHVI